MDVEMKEAPAEDPVVVGAQETYDRALAVADAQPQEAITALNEILATDHDSEEMIKLKEQATYKLGEVYGAIDDKEHLMALVKESRPFFALIPKARTAKIVRRLIDLVGRICSKDLQIGLVRECVEWCIAEKRNFLRIRLQTKLARLLLEDRNFPESLDLLKELLKEVKKLDDKQLLVEIHLLESHVHLSVRNVPKAKAALTAARTNANSIYVGPRLQADIDMQGGTLNAEEDDFNTAFSYFFEAYGGYADLDEPVEGERSVKYMLLCKIMLGDMNDVFALINSKHGVKMQGSKALGAMTAVATAFKDRSLDTYQAVLDKYTDVLQGDPLVQRHLKDLYDTMLEQNICRIIEPYSHVEIQHVADKIKLPLSKVEQKLSQMILDNKFDGILDQGSGCLIVYEATSDDKTYKASIDTIKALGDVVDSLATRAEKSIVMH